MWRAWISGGFSFRDSEVLNTFSSPPNSGSWYRRERKCWLLYRNVKLPVLPPEVKGTKSRKYFSLGLLFCFVATILLGSQPYKPSDITSLLEPRPRQQNWPSSPKPARLKSWYTSRLLCFQTSFTKKTSLSYPSAHIPPSHCLNKNSIYTLKGFVFVFVF